MPIRRRDTGIYHQKWIVMQVQMSEIIRLRRKCQKAIVGILSPTITTDESTQYYTRRKTAAELWSMFLRSSHGRDFVHTCSILYHISVDSHYSLLQTTTSIALAVISGFPCGIRQAAFYRPKAAYRMWCLIAHSMIRREMMQRCASWSFVKFCHLD